VILEIRKLFSIKNQKEQFIKKDRQLIVCDGHSILLQDCIHVFDFQNWLYECIKYESFTLISRFPLFLAKYLEKIFIKLCPNS
jgi:hypothetical protein